MTKKTCILLLLGLALCRPVSSRSLVLPFHIDEAGQTAHRWLGKAFSFYLTAGLKLNNISVVSEEESQILLERHSIRFPFDITKATAITLARQNGIDSVALGTILFSEPASSPITVKISLIDVVSGRQQHLPLLRARSADVFKMQAELLRELLKALGCPADTVKLPELNLSLVNYERFIKGLLVSDPEKKAELLQPAAGSSGRSDFADFELAKVRLEQRQYAPARSLLEQIGDVPLFIHGKRFLLALTDWLDNRPEPALAQFDQLQRAGVFPVETGNNLGIIHMQLGDPDAARACFQAALTLRPSPEIFLNEVILLEKTGQRAQSRETLTRALALYPDDNGLLRLFSRCLSENENRGILENAFRSYVLTPPAKDNEPDPVPQLLNPFAMAMPPVDGSEAKTVFIEARSLFLEGDLESALSKVQQTLEINPFLAESHHLLSLIYLEKKQYPSAEMYGRSALFLQESAANYLLLIKVLKASAQNEIVPELLKKALEKFPDDRELRELNANPA
jgi:tetratricopeptide (TPR) repeat protein